MTRTVTRSPSFVTKCVSSTDLALLHSLASRILSRKMTQHDLSVLLTTLQANEPHASTFQLSLTIVLPRRQPSPYPCGSRSVMGYLGTDSSSRPRDDQPSSLPLGSTTAVPAHRLFAVRDLTSFVANTTSSLSSTMYCNRPEPDM